MTKKATKKLALTSILSIFAAIYFLSTTNSLLATRLNRGISNRTRVILSKITGIFDFSLFEILLFISPLLIFLAVIYICKAKNREDVKSRSATIALILSISFVPYTFCIGIAKNSNDLSEKIINTSWYGTYEDVMDTANYLSDTLCSMDRGRELSVPAIDAEVAISYKKLSEKYSLPEGTQQKTKRFIFADLFSKFGVLGLYSPIGEININDNIPQYMIPFTIAHEFAHTLGASSEADANFLAYTICTASDKPFIRYSAMLSVLEYFMAEDSKIYTNVYKNLAIEVKNDLKEWEIYESRHTSKIGAALDLASGTYLDVTDKHGKKSYSEIVRYVTAYHLGIK